MATIKSELINKFLYIKRNKHRPIIAGPLGFKVKKTLEELSKNGL